jgi:hypothetical protein
MKLGSIVSTIRHQGHYLSGDTPERNEWHYEVTRGSGGAHVPARPPPASSQQGNAGVRPISHYQLAGITDNGI